MGSVFRVMYLKDTVNFLKICKCRTKGYIVVLVHTDPGKIPKNENLAVQDLRKRQLTLVGQFTEFIKGNLHMRYIFGNFETK